MPVRRYHVSKDAVDGEVAILDDSIPFGKLSSVTIQAGRTSVSFPFSVTGVENTSTTITFPKAFATAPLVVVAIEGINVGIVAISSTTTNFSITVRDDVGTDYTASTPATVHWIAIKV